MFPFKVRSNETLRQSGTPPLSVSNLSVHYPGQLEKAVDSVDWSVSEGSLAAIVGPNGAGKSSFLKALIGLEKPAPGCQIRFWNQPLDQRRKDLAYMPQRSSVDWTFPVSALDVAAMGLYGRRKIMRRLKRSDYDQAHVALSRVGMQDFSHRQIGALSGGQQQRVFLARALAQDPQLFLMDEPLAGIDLASQDVIFDVFSELRRVGKTIVIVHHDLYSVGALFDEALLLNRVRIASGKVGDVLTPENLQRAYHVPLKITLPDRKEI